jgi:hypothetical protein
MSVHVTAQPPEMCLAGCDQREPCDDAEPDAASSNYSRRDLCRHGTDYDAVQHC